MTPEDQTQTCAAPQPVGEPAENSFEWFQREIQRLQQHVAEKWPGWMKRTSGLSTATFPTVGEVPMPEPDGRLDPGWGAFVRLGCEFDDSLNIYATETLHTYGEQCRAAGYAAGVAAGGELNAAARSVLDERQRQISKKGWTPEHDDEHSTEEMAFAAACYCTADEGEVPPAIWPWDISFWKPTGRRRNLVKAGALILAEIERLDRAALRGEVKP